MHGDAQGLQGAWPQRRLAVWPGAHLARRAGQAVEDMCLHRMADRLYGSLQRECDAHIGRQLADLAAAQTADPTIFLQQVAPFLRKGPKAMRPRGWRVRQPPTALVLGSANAIAAACLLCLCAVC